MAMSGLVRSACAIAVALAATSASSAGILAPPLDTRFAPIPAPLGEYLVGPLCTTSTNCSLWAIDPVGSGTREIKHVRPGFSDSLSGFTRVGDRVLFFSPDFAGQWLMTTDGTSAGTAVVPVTVPQPFDHQQPVVTNDVMIFVTSLGGFWRSDGTAAGTFKIADGTGNSGDHALVQANGLAFFRNSDYQLWKTDGSPAGTAPVTNLGDGVDLDGAFGLTVAANKVYFQGFEEAGAPAGLYASDGSAAVRLATVPGWLFRGGSAGSTAILFESNHDPDGSPAVNLWRSDGTPEGTSMVMHLSVDIPFEQPELVGSAGSYFYFVTRNLGLWRTDGTVAGTQQVIAGGGDTALVSVGDAIYVNVGSLKMVNDSGVTDVDPVGIPWGHVGHRVLHSAAPFYSPLWVADGTTGETRPIVIADGPAPVVGFTTSDVSVEESGSTTIGVQRVNSEGAVSVRWSTANGTAIAGDNFGTTGNSSQLSGVLTWADGETGLKTLTIGGAGADIPLIDDSINQPAGHQFAINLSNVSPGASLGTAAATISIVDDDSVVQLASATASVIEGRALVLTLRRTGMSTQPVTAHWTTTPGTAIPGADYALPGTGDVIWAATDTLPKTISIPILQNPTPEVLKQFTVNIASADNARVGASSSTQVTIVDDDSGVLFASPLYQVAENAGRLVLTVNRTGSSVGAASVRWTTVNDLAQAGLDFGVKGNPAQMSGMLSWMPGDGTPKSISIPILQDSLIEGPEKFAVALSNAVVVVLCENSAAIITILDDDIPLESNVSFTQPKVVVVEGTPTAELAVHRESAGAGFTTELTVSYTTAPGTALVTTDFTAKTGTLTWAGDDSSDKTIAIPIVNNAVSESPKAFKVRISTASPGAQVTTPEAIVTILDDDEAFPRFGAVPDDWTMPAGADGGWHVSNEAGAYEGVYSLRSDEILDGQAAQIETARDLGAGAITFRVKISSEPGFDILRFYVDGVEKGSWSGTSVAGWQLFSTPVTAGSHTLRWSYEKDVSASMGQDAAWIDAVTLP